MWEALVAPGLRDWYYRLTPRGELVEGGRIEWVDVAGRMVEESDVVRVDPPRRLELSTRYLFTPDLAALPPHRLAWTAVATPGGCEAGLEWDAGEQVSAMLEAEAGNMLLALRLAADPKERAALARLESIGTSDVRDLTPGRIDDYLAFFDHQAFRDYPAWSACYCTETHRAGEDDGTSTAEENRGAMVELIKQGKVTALLAYVDDRPVGWCNYGETTVLAGVMRRFQLEPADHAGVGSISCFIIAAPYRRHGLATRLLDAALERMRALGLKTVEAYPAAQDDSAQANYRGPLGMYLKAGFEPYREVGRQVVVRKAL